MAWLNTDSSKFTLSQDLVLKFFPNFEVKNIQGVQKNARSSLEANISGLKKPIRKSKTSFEIHILLASIWAQE